MTSRHASDGGRRGLAPWIIVTAIVVVLVAAATTAYLLIVRSDDNDSAASNCTSQVVLTVAAAPGATSAISAAATAFDATAPVARSACVSTTVTTTPGDVTAQDLVDQWTQNQATAPAMWVPDSEAGLLAVEESDSALTAGRNTDPIATSPVVLAVRDADATAAAALSWQDLPAQTGPNGTVSLPAAGHVTLALPDPTTNRATSYALQSVLAADAPDSAPVEVADVTADGAELTQLGAQVPVQPATTEAALTQLAAGNAPFTAVPVVASDLTAFSAANPGLTAVSPQGSAVGDAIWVVPLSADWVTPTLEDAAARFAAFLRSPAGAPAFTDNGLELPNNSSAPSSSTAGATGTTDASAVVPDGGAEVAAALATAIGAAPAG